MKIRKQDTPKEQFWKKIKRDLFWLRWRIRLRKLQTVILWTLFIIFLWFAAQQVFHSVNDLLDHFTHKPVYHDTRGNPI